MNWLCKLIGHKIRHSEDILFCERCGWARHNPTSIPPAAGITKLSELTIDVDKDWGGYPISNLGAPTADGDALRRGDEGELDHALLANLASAHDHANLSNVTAAQHHDPAAQLEGESAGLREEHGEETIDGAAAAGDATWDTRNRTLLTVSFATAFSTSPVGVSDATVDLASSLSVGAIDASDITLMNSNFGTSAGDAIYGRWMAIGS